MDYRRIAESNGLATYALIFVAGDEAASELLRFAKETGVNGASLTGVGAASDAKLGWFSFDEKRYLPNVFPEQLEVLSFLGDIATTEDGEPQCHVHVSVAKRDGSAHGGHLMELHVNPTLEVVVTESPTHLRKRSLPDSPIATIRLGASG